MLSGTQALLAIAGWLLLIAGIFLLMFPGSPVDASGLGSFSAELPSRVVNLQKLVVGATSAIVGAIFLVSSRHR